MPTGTFYSDITVASKSISQMTATTILNAGTSDFPRGYDYYRFGLNTTGSSLIFRTTAFKTDGTTQTIQFTNSFNDGKGNQIILWKINRTEDIWAIFDGTSTYDGWYCDLSDTRVTIAAGSTVPATFTLERGNLRSLDLSSFLSFSITIGRWTSFMYGYDNDNAQYHYPQTGDMTISWNGSRISVSGDGISKTYTPSSPTLYLLIPWAESHTYTYEAGTPVKITYDLEGGSWADEEFVTEFLYAEGTEKYFTIPSESDIDPPYRKYLIGWDYGGILRGAGASIPYRSGQNVVTAVYGNREGKLKFEIYGTVEEDFDIKITYNGTSQTKSYDSEFTIPIPEGVKELTVSYEAVNLVDYTFNSGSTTVSLGATTTMVVDVYMKNYTIYFDSDGGSSVSTIYGKYGNTFDVPTSTKKGYTLSYWYNKNGYYLYPGETFTIVSGGYGSYNTFYATWNPTYARLIYTVGTGSGTPPTDYSEYVEGGTFTFLEPTSSMYKDGYEFSGWRYNGVDYQPGDSATYSEDYGSEIVAQWKVKTYTVTIETDPDWGGTVRGAGDYTYESTAQLVATPATNCAFDGWYKGTYRVSSALTYNLTVTEDTTITAKFRSLGLVIQAVALPEDGGVTSGSGSFLAGNTCTISATTNSGYTFLGWYLNGELVSQNSTFSFSVSVTATYVALYESQQSMTMSLSENKIYINVGATKSVTISTSVEGASYSVEEGEDIAYISGNSVIVKGSCPAGYHRVQIMGVSGQKVASAQLDVFINTPTLPTMVGSERVAIFKSDGSYCLFGDYEGGLAEASTVRFEEDAPTKAVVQLVNNWAVLTKNVRAEAFNGWSSGTGSIVEGMQMVIDKRDELTGDVVRVFNDTIKKIEVSSSVVTLTGYDCLLALSEYREQHMLSQAYTTQTSYDVKEIGAYYTYKLPSEINTLHDVQLLDTICQMPDVGTITTSQDTTSLRAYRFGDGYGPSSLNVETEIYSISAIILQYDGMRFRVHIYDGDENGPINTLYSSDWYYYTGTTSNTQIYHRWELDAPFSVTPGQILYYALEAAGSGSIFIPFGGSAKRFQNGTYYAYNRRKKKWVEYGEPAHLWPIAVPEYRSLPRDVDLNNVIQNNETSISIPKDVVEGASERYRYGIAAITSGFSEARAASSMIGDLVERAGFYFEGSSTSSKSLSYYDTSTYDYLSCIHDLLNVAVEGGADNGRLLTIQANRRFPGYVICRTKASTTDVAHRTITTDPLYNGEMIIRQHSLQRTFEAEGTVPTIFSKLSTNNTPLAIQTDDVLFNDSVQERIGYPSVEMITDNTLQTHNELAIYAESKIKRLHRNLLEGQIDLTKVAPSLWASDYDSRGSGKTIAVYIPMYTVLTNVMPRILILGNHSTKMDLDNVRLDNRTILNQSVQRGKDSQSFSIASLPDSAYIFLRTDETLPTDVNEYVRIELYNSEGDPIAVSSTIRVTTDNASQSVAGGYVHISALYFQSSVGYATTYPVKFCKLLLADGRDYFLMLHNGIYAWADQYIHVSIRGKK